jgi:hypothetical protein
LYLYALRAPGFSLAERKTKHKKKEKYRCERSGMGYRVSPVSDRYPNDQRVTITSCGRLAAVELSREAYPTVFVLVLGMLITKLTALLPPTVPVTSTSTTWFSATAPSVASAAPLSAGLVFQVMLSGQLVSATGLKTPPLVESLTTHIIGLLSDTE